MTDELITQVARIFERARDELLTLLPTQQPPVPSTLTPLPEWMSATQLAEYWQLYNDKKEPTTAGILKWSSPGPHRSEPPLGSGMTISKVISSMRLLLNV
jgi:hypothetical protein